MRIQKLTSLCMMFLLISGTYILAQGKPDHAQRPAENPAYQHGKLDQHWCLTEQVYQDRYESSGKQSFFKMGCPTEGPCDDPINRDATPITAKTINTIVHVMRRNSGSGGVSQATVDATMAQVNADFAGTGIDFNLLETRFHNDNNYSCISAYSQFNSRWYQDIQNMKVTYSESPQNILNIFISCQDSSSQGTLFGIATFPWDSNALTSAGGLWLNNIAVGTGVHTASHEIGHNLGLWHTHHGVSEVNSCSDCYEFASGADSDNRGDFASDTPSTPRNYSCNDPGGNDCQGTPFGNTQTENFMGYGPDSCQDLFTSQQISRMHCWTDSVLSGYLDTGTGNQSPNASFTANTSGLSVSLDGSASNDPDGTITSYAWSYGDGNTGLGATANHTYGSSGTYAVTLTVTDNDGASTSTAQSVTVSDGSSVITLSTNGYKVRGRHRIDLSWSGANSSTVDIYRNGSYLTTTANDGSYTDATNNRGGGSYTYEVCEAGTSTCSASSTVNF